MKIEKCGNEICLLSDRLKFCVYNAMVYLNPPRIRMLSKLLFDFGGVKYD